MSSALKLDSRIRKTLKDIDPAYEKEIHESGFYYRSTPMRFSKIHMRTTMAFLEDYFGDRKEDLKILDYACGTGNFLLHLWHRGWRNIEGRDMMPKMVKDGNEMFRRLAPKAPPPLKAVAKKEINKIRGKHDVITMFGLMSPPRTSLNSIRRTLNPNGLFFTNNAWAPWQMKLWMRRYNLRVHQFIYLEGIAKNCFYIAQKKPYRLKKLEK